MEEFKFFMKDPKVIIERNIELIHTYLTGDIDNPDYPECDFISLSTGVSIIFVEVDGLDRVVLYDKDDTNITMSFDNFKILLKKLIEHINNEENSNVIIFGEYEIVYNKDINYFLISHVPFPPKRIESESFITTAFNYEDIKELIDTFSCLFYYARF